MQNTCSQMCMHTHMHTHTHTHTKYSVILNTHVHIHTHKIHHNTQHTCEIILRTWMPAHTFLKLLIPENVFQSAVGGSNTEHQACLVKQYTACYWWCQTTGELYPASVLVILLKHCTSVWCCRCCFSAWHHWLLSGAGSHQDSCQYWKYPFRN